MGLFLAKYDHFFRWSGAYCDSLFEWGSAYICQKLRTELLYEQIKWDTIDIALVN